VGGGAAGFFGAISCAEQSKDAEIVILEKTSQFLQKVRISGGGRCNVTHACFDARELTANYPRGQRELIGPYHQFQAEDAVRWFESRGVKLKVEADGRMFPRTDCSQTIIDCLLKSARDAGVQLRANRGVTEVTRTAEGFALKLSNDESFFCDRLLLATGGCRTLALGGLAVSLGHSLETPVPSLFTFHVEVPWVRNLAGISIPDVEVTVPGTKLQARSSLLFTHWGVSGPAILRLSAWGARLLHERGYNFPLVVNWLPGRPPDARRAELLDHARQHAAKLAINSPLTPIPRRVWQAMVECAAIPPNRRWNSLTATEQQSLCQRLTSTELPVTGKSLNKEEFVTCGGVRLNEVSFKTMESKICPGLYFAGELLDIDGITGGFNFQAAWTTGWIAGQSIARASGQSKVDNH
jgi:hypothetical protein